MNYLFIFPPGRGFKIAIKKIFPMNPFSPPLGILYLSSMLEKNDHNVEVLDYSASPVNESELSRKIRSVDAVGMSITTSSLEPSLKLAKFIQENDPDIPLIIGGPHCTLIPDRSILDFNANICVVGDGEFIINKIAENIEGKRDLNTIPGIYYLERGKIKKTNLIQVASDLNLIPFPARHLVEKYDYGYFANEKLTNGKTTAIITSRGCPNRCKFCGYQGIAPYYNERSVDNVIKEFDEIIAQGYHSIFIVDNNFLANKKRAIKIMDRIIERKMNIDMWILGARVDSVQRELWERMRDAGVKFLTFGIESGNQDVLNFYNKRTNLQQVKKAIILSKEMGFFTSGSFIIGAPIETKKHIEDTIKFAKSLSLDLAQFMLLSYICGSPLWKEAVDKKKIPNNTYGVYANSRLGLGNFTEEELKKYCVKAYRQFYLNPQFIWRQMKYAFRKKDLKYIKMGLNMFNMRKS